MFASLVFGSEKQNKVLAQLQTWVIMKGKEQSQGFEAQF